MRTTTLVMMAALTPLACYAPPQETRGANEAIAIYARSVSKDGSSSPSRFHGASSSEGGGGGATRLQDAPEVIDTPLTVDRAIALAKTNSARLAELGARIAASDAGIEAAGQRNNPELAATHVRVGRAIDRGEDLRVTPRIRLFPERPGEIAARQAESRAMRDEVRAAARAEELAIEAEIRWLFDDALLLDAEIAARERALATRRKLAAQTREQLATATATAIDASLADLSAIDAQGQLAERRSRRALVVAELLDRIGRAPSTNSSRSTNASANANGNAKTRVELAGDALTWPPSPLPTEQILIEKSLRQSPRVAGAAASIDATVARLDLEQQRRWPWFHFVEIGYEFQPSPTNVPLWTLGTGIELPVLSSNSGAIHQAQASKSAAKQRLEAEVERIVREVRMRLREVNEAAALVTELRAVASPVLDRVSTEVARALESGAIDTIAALSVEERKNHVEIELLNGVRRHRTALDALRRAVGGPLPTAGARTQPNGTKP